MSPNLWNSVFIFISFARRQVVPSFVPFFKHYFSYPLAVAVLQLPLGTTGKAETQGCRRVNPPEITFCYLFVRNNLASEILTCSGQTGHSVYLLNRQIAAESAQRFSI
jgi:hypothetical protein